MLTHVKKREFKNGTVHLLQTEDGYPLETTDTFLPFYTKDAISRKQNCLDSQDLGTRYERWMVGVSTMSGCPVRCKFCATAKLKKWRSLTWREIVEQVKFIIEDNYPLGPFKAREFKINYTRMGEPFLNIENVRKAIEHLDSIYPGKIHHYISTIGLKGSDFSWIQGNITLQVSLHSLDEIRRKELIPMPNLMSMQELGQIRTGSKLKTTLNMTLVDERDFNIEKLKEYFDPRYFFIKLSPINPNEVSDSNLLGKGLIKGANLI
jgi:23S rRNA (adenine2503-C2)-methyltransferase